MDGTKFRIDEVDVRQTDDDLTLSLGAAGAQILLLLLRYDDWIDEVLNDAGSVAPGPGAWTLIDRDLSLEFGSRAAADLGFPRDFRLHLDLDDDTIRRVRAAPMLPPAHSPTIFESGSFAAVGARRAVHAHRLRSGSGAGCFALGSVPMPLAA